ncbi:MAG: ATP-binding protein [Ferruginibacter sp.]
MEVKKIVIVGPESTGKSTLCTQLAAHYKTVWAKEYAREYLLAHASNYTFSDLDKIAEGQLEEEEAAIRKAKAGSPVFIDTDMYVIKVWSEFVFNKCNNRVLTRIAERKYDLYLLCNTDLPWVKDELREYPNLQTREKLFHYYKDLLVNQHVPWAVISGNYSERLQMAINAVDKILG